MPLLLLLCTNANATCDGLASRVNAIPGTGPVFLRSYDSSSGTGPESSPALATAAFTYDNALATLALFACGRKPEALRIAEALLSAATLDRAGRLRNAYRAGAQTESPLPPNGWWDKAAGRWVEDSYQVGTSTGNVAWAALALLHTATVTGESRFRVGAQDLALWVVSHARDAGEGFSGGVHGDGSELRSLGWKSTEHNADLVAVFAGLGEGDEAPWKAHEVSARRFLEQQWQPEEKRFLVGTLPDGKTPQKALSGLDSQVFPLMLDGIPSDWYQGYARLTQDYAVDGGYDYNTDRDGVWLEGTAQVALTAKITGHNQDAERLLQEIQKDISASGMVWATRKEKITTGLAIGPESKTDDFFYYRRPHVGATAWAVLAALCVNPLRTGLRPRCP